MSEDTTPTGVKPGIGHGFEMRLTIIGDPGYSTFEIVAAPHILVRGGTEIRRGVEDLVLVVLVNNGTAAAEQRDRSVLAHVGDILAIFMDVPFTLDHRGGRSVTGARLPASAFPPSFRDRSPLLLSPRATPVAAVAAGHLRWQPDSFEALTASRDLVRDQLIALLGHGMDMAGRPAGSGTRLAVAARSMIEAEIANPALSAKLLCARLGVSRTTLFEALAADGDTLGNLIRERRLAGCLDDIMHTSGTDTLAAISERWGFRDQSTFTRAFRRRFG